MLVTAAEKTAVCGAYGDVGDSWPGRATVLRYIYSCRVHRSQSMFHFLCLFQRQCKQTSSQESRGLAQEQLSQVHYRLQSAQL